MSENRVYRLLPEYLKTDFNKKQLSVADDLLFEPTNFKYVEGQIGDQSTVTDKEKQRIPFLNQYDSSKQSSQLTTAAVYTDDSGDIQNGAFYDDLIGHIETNGGIVDDPEKLFECDYYSFNPPIDVDKWTNFQKYYWTGFGTASDFGEFLTKDAEGTQVVLHFVESDSFTFTSHSVKINIGSLPLSATTGDLIEDTSTHARLIYRWSGTAWTPIQFAVMDDLPVSAVPGTWLYVARTGYKFQRQTLYHYSASAGRYLSKQVVISSTVPDDPIEGMIWEDVRNAPQRRFSIYTNQQWLELNYTPHSTYVGVTVPSSHYFYDTRSFTDVGDDWSTTNFWVHINDLSPTDKVKYDSQKATRPIVSFWQGIEAFSHLKPTTNELLKIRNSTPLFNVYMYDGTSLTNNIDNFAGNTIFELDDTQRKFDTVLERFISYDSTGDILFKLTLETESYKKSGVDLLGYKFFKDIYTGLYHSVWTKAQTTLAFDPDTNVVPLNLSNNANHQLETAISRRTVLAHYRSLIAANADGLPLGDNTYRWTDRNPVTGGVIIDTEGSLLLNHVCLFNDKFDIPNAIRAMAAEYSKFTKRFHRKLNTFWTDSTNVKPTGELKTLTTSQALDAILSTIFVNVDSSRPFYNSKMGTFNHTSYLTAVPIMIPASPARIGAIETYLPRKISYSSTESYILGHDGTLTTAYGDDRDLVVLALETRFYNEIPVERKTETVPFSGLLKNNYFSIDRYVGNKTIVANQQSVAAIVNDYTAVSSPANGYTVYSRIHGKIATFIDQKWNTTVLSVSDIFFNNADSKYYTFNGFNVSIVNSYNKTFSYDYNVNQYNAVVRKEFERWYIERGLDPTKNTIYDDNDKFSWNFDGAGIEGYWKGFYRRVYGTDRPHICPWEILGFSIKPTWWDTVYTADATVGGIGVWYSTNAMWADLPTATLIKADGVKIEDWQLMATVPLPVNTSGVLLDPLTAGFTTLDVLNKKNSDWIYGDGSPIETQFYYSVEGRYAIALAEYLLKPARFVEFLWSDFNFTIGYSTTIFGGEVQVSDATYKRRDVASIKIHAEASGYSDMGLNSWIAENLLVTGNTPKLLSQIIHNAEVALGWQVNGFIQKNSTLLRTSSGIEIPFEDTYVVLHKSQPTQTLFYSGVSILKRGATYQIYGFDYSKPYFRTKVPIRSSIGGQTEQIQTFIATAAQTKFTLTEFSITTRNDLSNVTVLVDGYKVESYNYTIPDKNTISFTDFVIANGQTVTVILDTYISASPYTAKSFKIGNKTYIYFDQPSNDYVDYMYGHEFDSPDEIVQFLSDYQNYLSELGFVFENENWIGVATRFAVWDKTAPANTIYVDVANGNEIKLKSSFGFAEDFKLNQYGGYNIIDLGSRPITEFSSYRFDDELTVKASTLIYGLRIVIKNYQHAVFISNRTKFNDLIYDPFSGLKQSRILVATQKTVTWDGRLRTDGYIPSGDVLIPNLEKSVSDISKLYDSTDTTGDAAKTSQSLGLYNYFYKSYMKGLGVSQTMAFDYHKHMIREKGTKRAVVAFSKAKSNTQPLEIRECWAWKTGDFGRDRIDYAEIALVDTDFLKKLQTFIFANTGETDSDVIIKDFNVDDTRWKKKAIGNNISFPTDINDTNILINVLQDGSLHTKLFRYDPLAGLYDPYAISQVDIKSAYDPAYYTFGIKIYAGYEWDDEQLGTIWWDTSKVQYEDYKSDSITLDQSAELWGNLKSYAINAITTSGGEYTATLNQVHNFVVDDLISIELSDNQTTYKALVFEVPSSNQISFTLVNELLVRVLPAMSNDYLKFRKVTKSEIAVYQWISSSDDPFTFIKKNPTLSLKYGASPTYSSVVVDGATTYYFWVRGQTAAKGGKNISSDEIERRLTSPSNLLLPWFGIKDQNKLIIDTTTIGPQHFNISLEISIEPLNFERNNQWLILPEEDTTNLVSTTVINKIIDSITLSDSYGNTLPFRQTDPFGTLEGQVLFLDVDKAKETLLESLNTTFKKLYKLNILNLPEIFDDGAEWWDAADYSVISFKPAQFVQTMSDLTSLIDNRDADTVEVKRARIENSVYYSEIYQYINGGWQLVQAANGTYVFNDGFFDVIREKFLLLMQSIDAASANDIIFTMIHEMLVQQKDCDWVFKTSYIDVRNFIDNTTYAVKPIDEGTTISDNIEDVKPYRTKVREMINTHNIYSDNFEYDQVQAEITEDFQQKLTTFADRLSCNLFDDFSYDLDPYDVVPYDYAPWDRNQLATTDWNTIASFSGVSTKLLYVTVVTRRFLQYRIMTFDASGNAVNTPLYRLDFDKNDLLTIEFMSFPPANHTFQLQASTGTASSTLLDATVIDSNFTNIESTYEHAAAVVRSRVTGVHNNRINTNSKSSEFTGCSSPDVDDGGDSAERVRTGVGDRISIRVTTDFTDLFSGYDTAPYDYTPYDDDASNANPSTYIWYEHNDTYPDAVLVETIPAAVDISITSSNFTQRVFFPGNSRYYVTAAEYVRSSVTVPLVAGTDYDLLNNNAIKLKHQLNTGDLLRLYIGSFRTLAKRFNITDKDTTDYSIMDTTFTYAAKPIRTEEITLLYVDSVLKDLTAGQSIINKPDYSVKDKVPSITALNTDLLDANYTIIDESDNLVKQYSTVTHSFTTIARTGGVPYYVETLQQSFTYSSGAWNLTFTVGTPVLTYQWIGFTTAGYFS